MTRPRTLVLNWTGAVCAVAVTCRDHVLGQRQVTAKPGQQTNLPGAPDGLPEVVATTLAQAGLTLHDITRIVVVTGPGSFTTLRAALAYAQGLSLALSVPIVGVSIGDALRQATEAATAETWFVGRDRLGRILLDRGQPGVVQALAISDLPLPASPITVIGEAACDVAAQFAAAGAIPHVVDRAEPLLSEILRAADLTAEAAPVRPLYVEPPATTVNHGKGRPAPIA